MECAKVVSDHWDREENFSKAETNDRFTLYTSLMNSPNWKMRPEVSNHNTTDAVQEYTQHFA